MAHARVAEHLPQLGRLPSVELLDAVAGHGLAAVRWIGLFDEFVQAVNEASAHLVSVHLVTRAKLRYNCPADGLLADWLASLRLQWQARGVCLTMEERGVHTRRVRMVGRLSSLEVSYEWGLAVFQDTAATKDLPLASRTVRRCEYSVLRFSGFEATKAAPPGSRWTRHN